MKQLFFDTESPFHGTQEVKWAGYASQGCIRERRIGNRWIPNGATWKHESQGHYDIMVLKDVEGNNILMYNPHVLDILWLFDLLYLFDIACWRAACHVLSWNLVDRRPVKPEVVCQWNCCTSNGACFNTFYILGKHNSPSGWAARKVRVTF